MAFKLLAIRPLEGCDQSLLKGLKPNDTYQFYNEYNFIYPNRNVESALPLEDNLYYYPTTIEYRREIPEGFFAMNISISAIVGQNGSGKSSLLELYYIFLYNISRNFFFNKEEKEYSDYKEIVLEVYIEFNETNKDESKIGCYYMICKRDKFKLYYLEYNKDELSENALDYYLNKEKIELNNKNFNNRSFNIYSLISNYGLYGLNSSLNDNKWLDSTILFHNKRGYELPITISPYRDLGNIDVNREYILAQQRLIINHFVIKNQNLLDNIKLESVDYYIDTHKQQFTDYPVKEGRKYANSPEKIKKRIFDNDIILKNIFVFLEENFGSIDIKSFTSLISNKFRLSKECFNELNQFWETNVTKRLTKEFFISSKKDSLTIVELQYLAFLYLFKKIEKISKTYSVYKDFNYLFDGDLTLSDNFKKLKEDFVQGLNYKLSGELLYKSDILVIEKILKKYFNMFRRVLAPGHSLKGREMLTDNHVEPLSDFLENIFVVDVIEKEYFLNKVVNYFEKIYKRERMNQLDFFLQKIANDQSHRAFKIRQVLSYFNDSTFQRMIADTVFDKELNLTKVIVKNDFIESDRIDKVPLAFFDVKVNLKKSESNDLFSFSNLSSGEQQMIYSLLNITYNLFNLRSTYNMGGRYQNINLIFDEIELYFHPEYQRKYVNQLIETLNFFTEDTKYPMNINVIFSTHSPFILSDIPSQNILKLEEGVQIKDKETVNSFGANIHDLLANEFFLKEGTVGEFANKRISELINLMYLNIKIKELEEDEKNLSVSDIEIKESYTALLKHFKDKLEKIPNYSSQEITNQLKLIGEPLVRLKMQEMLLKMNEKMFNHKN
ncbi:AAA family ATPase [Myroides profundi]|uniref:AAA ATPase domain-containing protein n=1 Tax=Myroides profundi TaxID=480520 RepID=A0AAJ4W697_MYRPR|nr:AAA family ATPase [Myroides profundi]AJH14518.1 hypothetical protein MPR_1336 [Myroides profundi]SEQ94052.1 AAA ATPase domain-containing protein [Myroides profundi]